MVLAGARFAVLLIASLANVLLTTGCSRPSLAADVVCPTAAPTAGAQRPSPEISSTSLPNGTKYSIGSPVVTETCWPYPQIAFKPGNVVTISANGCVQIGGRGKTRKRYVDPRGPNSESLYHALVSIPGVTHGLVRLQDVIDTPLVIPPPDSSYLTLGFQDDFYPDNGYYHRDEGVYCQCLGAPDAAVIVTVLNASPAPPVIRPSIVPAAPNEQHYYQPPMASARPPNINSPSCPIRLR